VSETDRSAAGADAVGSRAIPVAVSAPVPDLPRGETTVAHLLAEALADRELAAQDRRRAAEYLLDAYRDDLTGVLSRRPGTEQLHAEVDRALRTGTCLAVMFVDIDGLKRVNDTMGHAAGDRLLAAAGDALRATFRSYDILVRYGGDGFVCALPGGTVAAAQQSGARALRALGLLAPGATFSIGHAQLRPGDTLESILRRADTDLYRRRAHVPC
jgi:diguanylate cyclase (GGDEF)-like protein